MKKNIFLLTKIIVLVLTINTAEYVFAQSTSIKNNQQNKQQNKQLNIQKSSTQQTITPASATSTPTVKKARKIDYNIFHKFLEKLENPSFSEKLTKFYVYKPNRIYRVYTTLFFNTQIIFPENERILYASTPLKNVFSFDIIKENGNPTNKLLIKTNGTDISTNLIVITDADKNYNLLLTSNEIKSNVLPTLTIYFKENKNTDNAIDKNLITDIKNNEISNSNQYTNTLYTIEDLVSGKNPNPKQLKDFISIVDKLSSKELKKINLINSNYKIFRNKRMNNPIRVFDDGIFTYFKFKQTNNLNNIKIPAILSVENRIEQPTNLQKIYGYLVVKSTHKQFILRRNKEYLCIEKYAFNSQLK